MQLSQVIYADVLFILNAYITYILMLATAIISSFEAGRLRLTLTALSGGLYSLIILIPGIGDGLITFSRVPAAVLFIFIAFGKVKLRVFVRLFSSFFLINFIFAGLMLALWYFIHPESMYMGGFVVYFDIKPLTLVVLTAVCYFAVKAISSIIKIRQPKNTIYHMTLHINNSEITMRAYYDTGNTLTDPFTGKQVIIVSTACLKEIFPEGCDIVTLTEGYGIKARPLPFDSLGGTSLMTCIAAQRVQIRGLSISADIYSPLIALTDKKIKDGTFAALLPSGIFDNLTSEKGEDYDESFEKLFSVFKR